MSVRKVQSERVLEEVVRSFYSSGVKPTIDQVLRRVGEYFKEFPAGLSLPLPEDITSPKQKSNAATFNQALARVALNLDVLYEASLDQVEEAILLVSTLTSQLDAFEIKRRRVLDVINDYLLSLFNTDGYFLSLSDSFADASLTDLTLTSAHVDVALHCVTLPTISSLTSTIASSLVGSPTIAVTVNGVNRPIFRSIAPFTNAFDGSSGTVWALGVDVPQQSEVVVVLTIPLGNQANTVRLSRFDFDPYGIVPVEMFAEYSGSGSEGFVTFGDKIQTSNFKMSLSSSPVDANSFRITLRKTKPDYVGQNDTSTVFSYIFGAKEVVFTEQVYDDQAIFVSAGRSIPADLQQEMVVDAVSLVVDDDTPPDTDIKYYISSDDGSGTQLVDFPWRRIQPVGQGSETVLNFNGAQLFSRYIRRAPNTGDIQLIDPDTTNNDLAKRNPSPSLIPGVDVYRLAAFTEDPPTQSFSLEEGINTTRIYYTDLSVAGVTDLTFWSAKIAAGASVTYGRIDTGNDFFYGGNIGESNKSVYVETYVDSLDDQELFLAELKKNDVNSQSWAVRVFLNGVDIGYLPPGTNSLNLPWRLKQGLNHVALAANIPAPTLAVPNPYIGTVSILGTKNLPDYGTVKLGSWNYVSLFDMKYNQTGQPLTFTTYNGEIISRRQPTDNFLLRYAKPQTGPAAIRVRADLSRDINNVNVSPKLNSYRLRFSYGTE